MSAFESSTWICLRAFALFEYGQINLFLAGRDSHDTLIGIGLSVGGTDRIVGQGTDLTASGEGSWSLCHSLCPYLHSGFLYCPRWQDVDCGQVKLAHGSRIYCSDKKEGELTAFSKVSDSDVGFQGTRMLLHVTKTGIVDSFRGTDG